MQRNKDPYTGNLNFFERKGLEILRQKCSRKKSTVDVWNDDQVADIQEVEHRTLWFAVISGAVSGAIIAGLELVLRFWLVDDLDTAEWGELAPFWAVHLTSAGIITIIEIFYLYRLMLRSVAHISSVGGLYFANESGDDVIAIGISRAALDMPNPRTEFYGIDPYLRFSRWKLLLYTLAYRAKIGMTSIILRFVMRRLLARMALRTFLPFIAIPLYAFWNGLICHWTMREARGRIAAPIAIRQITERIKNEPVVCGHNEERLLIALIAETMMRARDSHPNFLLLLKRLFKQFEIDPNSIDKEFDWEASCKQLATLNSRMQSLALDVLQVAVALGGPPHRRQRQLVKEAFDACGRTFDADALRQVYSQFIRGQGIAGLDSH